MEFGRQVNSSTGWIGPSFNLPAGMNASAIVHMALTRYADFAGKNLAVDIAA
jgi:hypothetical protein